MIQCVSMYQYVPKTRIPLLIRAMPIEFHKYTTVNQNDEIYYDILSEVCEDDFHSDSDSDSDREYNTESPVEFYGN